MAEIVQRAVQLNQHGVTKLARGDLPAALASFRSALQTMVSFNPAPDNPPYAAGVTLESADVRCLAAMGIGQVPAEDHCKLSGEEEEPFTYRRPFVFDVALLPRSQDGIAVFSAVVIFNMAVIFHQKTLMESNSYRVKALHLYESSIDLFTKISPRYDLSGVIAIALNNKASLYFAVADYESSDRELGRLETYMARAEHSMSTEAVMGGPDFQGMFMNLLMMKEPRFAQAA